MAKSESTTKRPAREAILESAMHLIAETGLHNTTQRKVAAEAGVSLAAVTYHFPRVEDLVNATFEQAVKTYIASMGRQRDEALAGRKSLAQACVDTMLDEKREPLDCALVVFSMLVESMRSESPREESKVFLQAARDFIYPWVGNPEDAYIASYAIIGASMSFLSLGRNETDALAEIERLFDRLGVRERISTQTAQ